jgi:hypothetical protein
MVGRHAELGGMAVTLEAHAHVQSPLLRLESQISDIAMAPGAGDAFGNVNTVIEVGEVGQPSHSGPLQRLPAVRAGENRLQHRGIGKDLRVAIQTGGRRREPGERGLLDSRMAKSAIDPQFAGVMAVAEHHGLIGRKRFVRPPRRMIILPHPVSTAACEQAEQ